MKVQPCNPYDARIESMARIAMPDGKSVFKCYYVSIVGREAPERYEWPSCGLSKEAFRQRFTEAGFEGIGFVTAFPHITKVFRYAPSSEILQHVSAFQTRSLVPIDLMREDGYMEFACYAEAVIAADEYHAWARADAVADYLGHVCDARQTTVKRHVKLAEYWN